MVINGFFFFFFFTMFPFVIDNMKQSWQTPFRLVMPISKIYRFRYQATFDTVTCHFVNVNVKL